MNEPNDEDLTELARIGYEAYGDSADWKNFEGKPMPKWDDLRPDICEKWKAASRALAMSQSMANAVDHVRRDPHPLNSGNSETLSNDVRSVMERAKTLVLNSILSVWDQVEDCGEGELVKEAHFNNVDLHWFEKVIGPDMFDSFVEPNFIRGKLWGATVFGNPSIPEGTLRVVGETKSIEGTLIRGTELDDYLNSHQAETRQAAELGQKSP